MELRQLRYFVVLAEELHFGRAARRLAMTQPPLSFNIRRLEEDMGVLLFVRSRKQVTLSAAGAAFLPRARELLERAEGAKQLARSVQSGSVGHLDIGFHEAMIYRGVPEIVTAFTKKMSEVEVVLIERSSRTQVDGIVSGHLDGGFLNVPILPPGLKKEVLATEHFMACVPSSHRLAGRKHIDLADLSEDRFVMVEPGGALQFHDRALQLCKSRGFVPKIRFTVARLLTIPALVSKGLGVALVPESLRDAQLTNVSFISIEPRVSDAINYPIGYFVWNPKRVQAGLEVFIEMVKEFNRPIKSRGRTRQSRG